MDKNIKLGSLEFRAEDFGERPLSFDAIAARANALLKERLEKAQALFQSRIGNSIVWRETIPQEPAPRPTLSARLVCVEEIKHD